MDKQTKIEQLWSDYRRANSVRDGFTTYLGLNGRVYIVFDNANTLTPDMVTEALRNKGFTCDVANPIWLTGNRAMFHCGDIAGHRRRVYQSGKEASVTANFESIMKYKSIRYSGLFHTRPDGDFSHV